MTSQFRTGLTAAAIASILSVGNAQAEIKGFATLQVNDVLISAVDDEGEGEELSIGLDDDDDIVFSNVGFNSNTSAQTESQGGAIDSNTDATLPDGPWPNAELSCVGPYCAGAPIDEDDFTQKGQVLDQNGNDYDPAGGETPTSVADRYFARADAVINNGNITTGGDAQSVSELSFPYPIEDDGQADASNSLDADFQFTTDTDIEFSFSFDLEGVTETFSGLDDLYGFNLTQVRSEWNFSVLITADDSDERFLDYSLSDLQVSNGAGEFNYNAVSLDDMLLTAILPAGSYTLQLVAGTGSSGKQVVPAAAPATLALLGLGMVGLGASRRRKV